MRNAGRVTIRDVAARAGVSVATVSKVLNNRYGVASATSERVKGVIEDLGYEASLVARSLRNHRTSVIGLLVADFEPFTIEVLKGCADAIRETGYELVVYSAGGRVDEPVGWERRYLSRLSGTLVDGAVLVTPATTDLTYETPIVAVDPDPGPGAMPSVDSAGRSGAALAVAHLVGLGHRRIAMITGRPDLHSARLREVGFRAAMADAGVPVDEELVQPGAFKPALIREATHRLLTLPHRPTAVFAANDVTAIVAMQVASELGVRVPDELSVVGFDNVPDAATALPPLTTVEQPMRQMGHDALRLLVRLIRDEPVEATHLTLPTRLVERGSTRAA